MASAYWSVVGPDGPHVVVYTTVAAYHTDMVGQRVYGTRREVLIVDDHTPATEHLLAALATPAGTTKLGELELDAAGRDGGSTDRWSFRPAPSVNLRSITGKPTRAILMRELIARINQQADRTPQGANR